MKKTRDNWVDAVKVFACILVASGHFFQGVCTSGILDATPVYQWFNRTIYYFHVPLFFICSGYIYQKYSKVNSLSSWTTNVVKKFVVLGVPYATFTLITWVLKSVFSGSVNTEVGNLGYALFVYPMSPYWYLFALFFIFLITPTFASRIACSIGIAASLLLKCLSGKVACYTLTIVIGNQLWFVMGMALCVFNFPATAKKCLPIGALMAGGFLILSFATPAVAKDTELFEVFMGILACTAVILIFSHWTDRPNMLAAYTMPIFLMHTIFAAGVRAVLLKVGITGVAIHVVIGLAVSFLGPIMAAELMRRTKLDFLLYPAKYMRGNKCRK